MADSTQHLLSLCPALYSMVMEGCKHDGTPSNCLVCVFQLEAEAYTTTVVPLVLDCAVRQRSLSIQSFLIHYLFCNSTDTLL